MFVYGGIQAATMIHDGLLKSILRVSLIGVNSIFTLLRAFLFAYGGIQAATMIHDGLLKSILRVSLIGVYSHY